MSENRAIVSQELPPLPERAGWVIDMGWEDGWAVIDRHGVLSDGCDVYTADQMQAYARTAVEAAIQKERERAIVWCGCGDSITPNSGAKCGTCAYVDSLGKDAVEAAILKERSECAALCDSLECGEHSEYGSGHDAGVSACAEAIRARKAIRSRTPEDGAAGVRDDAKKATNGAFGAT